MPKKDDPTLASLVGKSAAIVQHGLDKVIEWGFAKIKETSDTSEKRISKIKNKHLSRAAKIGRVSLRFLGEAGQAFYRTYDELKRESSDKK